MVRGSKREGVEGQRSRWAFHLTIKWGKLPLHQFLTLWPHTESEQGLGFWRNRWKSPQYTWIRCATFFHYTCTFIHIKYITLSEIERWDGSVGIAIGYGLEVRGFITSKGKVFLFFAMPQTGPDTHTAFYSMGTVSSFSWGKAYTSCDTTHLHLVPSSVMVELYRHCRVHLNGVMLN